MLIQNIKNYYMINEINNKPQLFRQNYGIYRSTKKRRAQLAEIE